MINHIELQQDVFRVAVEVTAGNSLHHVVVDTDATAARLIDFLAKERIGRVTFMPLNQLHERRPRFPQEIAAGNNATPLLDKIVFEEAMRPAMKCVGRKREGEGGEGGENSGGEARPNCVPCACSWKAGDREKEIHGGGR